MIRVHLPQHEYVTTSRSVDYVARDWAVTEDGSLRIRRNDHTDVARFVDGEWTYVEQVDDSAP